MFNEMLDKWKRKHSKVEKDPEEFVIKEYEPKLNTEIAAPAKHEIEAPVQKPENRSNGVELKVVRPESFEGEVSSIADSLIEGCTVVLNVEALDKPSIGRMLDFLNGVAYCLGGNAKRVAPTTFIITPHEDVDISDM